MSYAVSAALQEAIYACLSRDEALAAVVGGAVYDALPAGALPTTYVLVGEEKTTDRSDNTGAGARHDFAIAVISDATGFAAAKQAAAAASDALLNGDLTLGHGRLIGVTFRRAVARRTGAGSIRRIDLTFRALTEA